ncbi:hypothetical protein [Pseudomonas sp. MYb185]|uniref:hypothetical protein n=1 Tax=Pseudomonas sp. MYb185 TaxID=1848729 RepID=UPI001304E0E8|nr:hypothetical protein [Pseudomonas sp. MYb185]
MKTNNVVNASTIVAFCTLMLVALTANALHRSSEANGSRMTGAPCHTLHCHAMNPAHWL